MSIAGTDLSVSRLCLGGNRLGSALAEDASFALLDAFVELGGNFVDTALVYADWLDGVERSCSERVIGRWVRDRGNRDDLVLATKGGHPALAAPGIPRLDPASLRADLGRSVENLGGPVDLYYLHRDDPRTPVESLLETLQSFVEEGWIRHYGASNMAAPRLAAAEAWARAAGVSGVVADQLEWSLARPVAAHVAPDLTWMDTELADFHRRSPMTVVPYSPQARGYFARVLDPAPLPTSVARYDSPRNAGTAQRLAELAEEYDTDSTCLALAGLLHAGIPTVPVVGCRTVGQLRHSWSALGLTLSESHRVELVALAAP